MVHPEPATEDEKEGIWQTVKSHLNFYRVHLIFYTCAPLILSGIFYACNGRYHVSYIDALFNCVSAIAVCGLTTVNLSSLTKLQQVILFFEMCIGNPVIVSWVVVYLRRHVQQYYFAKKFEHIVENPAIKKATSGPTDAQEKSNPWSKRIKALLKSKTTNHPAAENGHADRDYGPENGGAILRKVRPEMIRRMDEAPKRINPSGLAIPLRVSSVQASHGGLVPTSQQEAPLVKPARSNSIINKNLTRRLSDPGIISRPTTPVSAPLQRSDSVNDSKLSPRTPKVFNRTQTVEFAPNVARRRNRPENPDITEDGQSRASADVFTHDRRSVHSRRHSLARQASIITHTTGFTTFPRNTLKNAKTREFGGFPMPFTILSSLFSRFFPGLGRKLTRTVTMPATTSLVSQGAHAPKGAKVVPYISFSATVGRNSTFPLLTNDQIEELGGVEFRALNALLWIVGGYHILTQLICFTVIAPYMSMPRWAGDFQPPNEVRPVPSPWFSLFQTVAAYTNTGMSLVDQSMVPFQRAYPMVFLMAFLILAGNTAFPVFLRFTIWMITKLIPKHSRLNETLHFLLDHPRRCFIFLFPSHQTWFLLTVVLGLTATDWFFFMILDIGNPTTEVIPLGVRFVIGLFQGIAVRAAGFSAISVASLAASVKVLYVIMMYISAYPIAMSVRSTNVYEEQSLGIFPEDETNEEDFEPTGPRITVWSRYLAMHARKQLAFDMWWLGLALFLLCIIERHNLDDPSSDDWFNIFSILFELVSAYGTVGLSLGVPFNNFAFSGSLRTLSKLILCVVMIRGRHRILPVAIDRAVMLPSQFQQLQDDTAERGTEQGRTLSRRTEDFGRQEASQDVNSA